MSAPPGTATTHSFCCFFHFDSYLYPFSKFQFNSHNTTPSFFFPKFYFYTSIPKLPSINSPNSNVCNPLPLCLKPSLFHLSSQNAPASPAPPAQGLRGWGFHRDQAAVQSLNESLRGPPSQRQRFSDGDQVGVPELGQALPSRRLAIGIGRPRFHRDSQRLRHAVRSGGQGHVRPVVECSSSASCSSEKLGRVSTRWVLSDPEVGNGPVLVERKRP